MHNVISVTSYPHGTTLTVFRNGMMAIDGQLLPEGVVDPWELARRVDKQFGRGERNPHNNLITSGYINAACTLELCTRDFAHAMDQIHYWHLTNQGAFEESTMSGCASAPRRSSACSGASTSACSAPIPAPPTSAWGTTWVSASTSRAVPRSSPCTPWTRRNENPVHIFAGDPIDGSLTTGVGAGVGMPVGASTGKSDTFAIWQFGGGEFGKNICQ